VKRRCTGVEDIEAHPRRSARAFSELALFEVPNYLWPALFAPRVGVSDWFAVQKHERVGERISPDLCFIVVYRDAGTTAARGFSAGALVS
jgi:hypothetical protein